MNENNATAEAESVSNISVEELIALRSQTAPEPESEEPVEVTEDDETDDWDEEPKAEESPETDDEPEAEEETPEKPSGEIDLLDLSVEQIQELARKGKSRLLSRVGELTARNKALEVERDEAREISSISTATNYEVNPFQKITDPNELNKKFQEFETMVAETDRILKEHKGYADEDIIEVGDEEFTKEDIDLANRKARDAMAKHLPRRYNDIVREGQREEMTKQFQSITIDEVPEIQDEQSEIGKQYIAMLADPLLKQVRLHVPDLAPQLPYLLAHAVRSIHRANKMKSAKAAGVKAETRVSSSPLSASASPSRPSKKVAPKNNTESISVEDWVASRIAKSIR